MLIITRRVDDCVSIKLKTDEELIDLGKIKILRIDHGKIRLGFEAKKEIIFIRDELLTDEDGNI